jgi:hypothetical protein
MNFTKETDFITRPTLEVCMHTITVSDVLNDTLPDSGWGKFRIYVFRDQDFVLYVGKTEQNIIDRIEEHLGLSHREESHVGQLVSDNLPHSLDWYIDLMTLADCDLFVQRHFAVSHNADVRLAEQAMIREYSPPLNRESNPNAHLLPHKYSKQKNHRTMIAHKKVFDDKQ